MKRSLKQFPSGCLKLYSQCFYLNFNKETEDATTTPQNIIKNIESWKDRYLKYINENVVKHLTSLYVCIRTGCLSFIRKSQDSSSYNENLHKHLRENFTWLTNVSKPYFDLLLTLFLLNFSMIPSLIPNKHKFKLLKKFGSIQNFSSKCIFIGAKKISEIKNIESFKNFGYLKLKKIDKIKAKTNSILDFAEAQFNIFKNIKFNCSIKLKVSNHDKHYNALAANDLKFTKEEQQQWLTKLLTKNNLSLKTPSVPADGWCLFTATERAFYETWV